MNELKVYISSEFKEFSDFIEIAREGGYGIEIQAFALPEIMYGQWMKHLISYKEQLKDFPNGIAFHNPFFSTVAVSGDYKVVENSREKMRYGFMVAKELGARHVVAHFNWWPFFRGDSLGDYVDGQLRFWDEFINFSEKENIILVMENTTEPNPEYIVPILEKANSPNFQMNWDIGHANVFSNIPLVDWIPAVKNFLKYIHFHNNDGTSDQHRWNESGSIDYEAIFKKLSETDLHPIVTTEIYRRDELLNALNFIDKIKLKYNL